MYVLGGFATSEETDTYSAGLFCYEVEAEGPDEYKCPPGLTGPNGGNRVVSLSVTFFHYVLFSPVLSDTPALCHTSCHSYARSIINWSMHA